MLKVAFLCVCIQLSNSPFNPSLPIGQRRVLVPDAAVVQLEDPIAPYVSLTHIGQRRALVPETAVVQLEDLTAHNVLSPPLNSDRGEMYVNQHTANISKLPLISGSSNLKT